MSASGEGWVAGNKNDKKAGFWIFFVFTRIINNVSFIKFSKKNCVVWGILGHFGGSGSTINSLTSHLHLVAEISAKFRIAINTLHEL